jgi:hypothetical protein
MAFDQTNAALATLGETITAVLPALEAAQAAEANAAALDASLAGQISTMNSQLAPFVPAPAAAPEPAPAPTDGSAAGA